MGLDGSSENYNDFGRRALSRGFAVLVPQLTLFWGGKWGAERDQYEVENKLRAMGGSLAALECTRIRKGLDSILSHPSIDPSRVFMAGLSYGGFYTLLTTMLDHRIGAAYSSCFLNNRHHYAWGDLTWFNSSFLLHDSEYASLIAPRPLYIDAGKTDEIFRVDSAESVVAQVRAEYARVGESENFVYHLHEGGHEFESGTAPLDFLCDKAGLVPRIG